MPKVGQGEKPVEAPVVEAEPEPEVEEATGLNMNSMVGGSAVATRGDAATAIEPDRVQTNPFQFQENPVFEQNELNLPRLRLLQGLSQEVQEGEGRPGHWVLSGYESMPEITFFPVGMLRRRERRNEEKNVVCRSADAVQGVGDPGIKCETCPFKEWQPNPVPGAKNIPPECSLIYDYLGIDVEKEEICVVSFQKTSTKTATWFNSMAMRKGGFGTFAVTLSSSAEQGKTGQKYFVPKPTLAHVDKTRLAELKELAFPQ